MDRVSGFSLFLMFLHPTFCFTEVAEVSVSAAEGEDCVLPCSGRKGVNVRILEWTEFDQRRNLLAYRGGKALQRYEDYTNRVQLLHPQLQSRDLSVVLNKVTFKDSGTYRCYASYDDGRESSQFIRLRVKRKDSDKSVSAAEGQDCVLPCSGLSGSEVSGLMWTDQDGRLLLHRGGQVLNGYEDSLYTNRAELQDTQLQDTQPYRDLSVVLKDVTLKDGGTYRCQALYEDGQRFFKFVRLTVTERKQDTGNMKQSRGLFLGLPTGLGLILVTVFALLCCFNKRLTRLRRHLTTAYSVV